MVAWNLAVGFTEPVIDGDLGNKGSIIDPIRKVLAVNTVIFGAGEDKPVFQVADGWHHVGAIAFDFPPLVVCPEISPAPDAARVFTDYPVNSSIETIIIFKRWFLLIFGIFFMC